MSSREEESEQFAFGRDAEETTRALVLREHTSAYQGDAVDKALAAASKAFNVKNPSARKKAKQKQNDFWPQAGNWLAQFGTNLVSSPSDLLVGSMDPADRLLFDYCELLAINELKLVTC
jgi:hypothetical protein